MKRDRSSWLLYLLLILLFYLSISCTKNNNNIITPKVEFTLLQKSDLYIIFDSYDCKDVDINSEHRKIAFMQIKSLDTAFVSVYSSGNMKFMIVGNHEIIKYQYQYLIDFIEPLWPSAKIDTVLPHHNMIYPFIWQYNNKQDNCFILEPHVVYKGFERDTARLPMIFKNIRQPFIIYKMSDGNIIECTDKVISDFNNNTFNIPVREEPPVSSDQHRLEK